MVFQYSGSKLRVSIIMQNVGTDTLVPGTQVSLDDKSRVMFYDGTDMAILAKRGLTAIAKEDIPVQSYGTLEVKF